MYRSTSRASSPEDAEHTLAHTHASGSNGTPGTGLVLQAESSPDTPPVQPPRASEHEGMVAGGAVSAEQMAALVGMTVTRGFDGVSGKVSTLVPGSDVVIIEWEDGDCEDMRVADMQRQGLL